MIKFNLKNIVKNWEKTQNCKLSIYKMAKDTGISRNSLTALYNGTAKGVEFKTLDKIVNYFNLPPFYFISHYSEISSIDIYSELNIKHNKDKQEKIDKNHNAYKHRVSLIKKTKNNNLYNNTFLVLLTPDEKIPSISILWSKHETILPTLDRGDLAIIACMISVQYTNLSEFKDNDEFILDLMNMNYRTATYPEREIEPIVIKKKEIIKKGHTKYLRAINERTGQEFEIHNHLKQQLKE